jgi:hypothetical protein
LIPAKVELQSFPRIETKEANTTRYQYRTRLVNAVQEPAFPLQLVQGPLPHYQQEQDVWLGQ